jgi:hypothetical protein
MLGLAYIFLAFLIQKLLRSFTSGATCGMNRCYRCPYPPFPFPTYYPDTGTGSSHPKTVPLSEPSYNPHLNRLRDA